MILIVNASDTSIEDQLMSVASEYSKHPVIKSRNMTSTTMDFTIELRTDSGAELLSEVMAIEGVASASLLSHDGEVTF